MSAADISLGPTTWPTHIKSSFPSFLQLFLGAIRRSASHDGFLVLTVELAVKAEDAGIDKVGLISQLIHLITVDGRLTIAQYSPRSFCTGVPDRTNVSSAIMEVTH
jgi:hypothetical protein